jgi:hypothetical protein
VRREQEQGDTSRRTPNDAVGDGRNDAQNKTRDGTRGADDRPLDDGCTRELVVYLAALVPLSVPEKFVHA